MRLKDIAVVVTFVFLAAAGRSAKAQANVVENESASVYVDANSGSNSNPGTQSQPYKTIQAAVNVALNNNVRGVGTRVLVNPGIYRESVSMYSKSGQTGAAITIQAIQSGTAFIDGADVLTNWNPGSTSGTYTYNWRDPLTTCSVPSGWPSGLQQIMLHREMVFVNGAALTQVLSPGDLSPGTFYVNAGAQQLTVLPGAGTDMTTATVEASARTGAFNISGRSNTVLRGLTVRHAAPCINQQSLGVWNSTNLLLDGVTSVWNNWGGVGIGASSNVTIQNSTASYNGGVGFSTFQSKNVLLQNSEADYNNWRGAQSALYDWGMGGAKLFSTHTSIVNSFRAYNNYAQGLWFDTDNKNATVTGASLVGNVLSNLQIEANEGPITVQNSALCLAGMGLNLLTSSNVTISGNLFYGNGNAASYYRSQVMVAGRAGGRGVTDWETKQYYQVLSTNTRVQGNSFQDGASGQQVFASYLNSTDWGRFASSFSSNSNHWYDAVQTNAFAMPGGKRVTMSGWQGATGQDSSSNWTPAANVGASCSVPNPSIPDFSIRADNRSYTMSNAAANLTINVRSFGQGSPVHLSVAHLPSGVGASISANDLANGAATIRLTASSSAAYQTVPVTIFANRGNVTHSVTVNVAVRP